MDLRVERTRKNIHNAFIQLRSKKPLEKITVKELSELAYINKATFYSHYHDIYDLSDKLEDELIASIIKTIPNPENIISDSANMSAFLTTAFTSHKSLLYTIFPDSRSGVLVKKLDTALKELIYKYHPQYKNNLEMDIVFTIMIQGGFYACINHPDADIQEVSRIIGKVDKCLSTHYSLSSQDFQGMNS